MELSRRLEVRNTGSEVLTKVKIRFVFLAKRSFQLHTIFLNFKFVFTKFLPIVCFYRCIYKKISKYLMTSKVTVTRINLWEIKYLTYLLKIIN